MKSYLPVDACWNWPGAKTKGYGTLQRGRRGEGTVGAHQVAWELLRGPIPVGLHVLHSCDNPSCVNPAHLFLGTNIDNINDSVAKGRRGRKLTREKAHEIRLMAGMHREIAQKFGVSRSMVTVIKNGKVWQQSH